MTYDNYVHSAAVTFFIRDTEERFTNTMQFMLPRKGDTCVFAGKKYRVADVEWMLDEMPAGVHPNIHIDLIEEANYRPRSVFLDEEFKKAA